MTCEFDCPKIAACKSEKRFFTPEIGLFLARFLQVIEIIEEKSGHF
jgi:hypothetical protein